MNNKTGKVLEEYQAPTKIKLALTWASLMFLYIYNDYFSMYTPGTITDMSTGRMGPLGQATEIVLVGVAILLAIPALMIFLSVVLPTFWSRCLNLLFGLAYTAVEVLTWSSPYLFYKIVVGLEIGLTLFIVWQALRWPKHTV